MSVTRQAMYVLRNNVKCSCNHCCSGKAVSITYRECLYVALGMQRAIRMRLVIYGLSGSTIFFATRFSGKKYIEHEVCVWRSSTTFV